MEMIGIALIVFSGVLMITVIFYVTSQHRHKEKIALLEKGLNPSDYQKSTLQEAARLASALIGAGLGFIIGVIVESSRLFPEHIELPLYIGPVFICMGIALLIYHRTIRKNIK